jgi:hypothetical protein
MPNRYNEKYSPELLTEAAANSISIAGVLRYLQIPWSGGTHSHISRRLKRLGIDTSHFLGQAHSRKQPSARRLTPEQILVALAPGSPRPKAHVLLRALIEVGSLYICAACGIEHEWRGKPYSLTR